ncbi:hypothetical protein [Asaia spathodeae]|uniref:hypothetical protein n=1 Tax=Asaia spathodeae TaxID=657016 RepID=UPI0021566E37|nr:hypothetical protein [Asaia spathodeae]GBR16869.1 hypothetical protein AA105894_1679 [Asaia spathodeae NBRC 105894]
MVMMPRITQNIDDISIPGAVAQVSHAEAIQQGAFTEDALSLEEVQVANIDLVGEIDNEE